MKSPAGLVEIALALVWRGELLLVTQRPAGVHLAGFWEFPGGKLEPEETPERCAVREVAEELGLRCRPLHRRPSIEHHYVDRALRLHPVDCAFESGSIALNGVADARWALPKELRQTDFPEANRALIETLRRQG